MEFGPKTYIAEIDGKWYAFEGNIDNNMVYSIGRDSYPVRGENGHGRYCGRFNCRGIKLVASASPSRRSAYAKASRYGVYQGVYEGV